MIDVTFLLLIYFLQTMIVAPDEDQLTPAIQTQDKESTGELQDFQPQIIEVRTISGDFTYRLGSQLFFDAQSLESALRPLPKDTGVFIRVHGDVPAGFAVSALQASHDAGFEKVTYVPAAE